MGRNRWGPFPPNTPTPITFHDAGDLAKSGVDITGAMFVGNIAHMDTFVGTVTNHTKGSPQFDVQLHINGVGNSKVGNSIYFVENLPSLIDQPTEWAYDAKTRTLWLKTDDGKSPTSRDVRRKVQTYALNVTQSSSLRLANMSFFGTTVNAQGPGIGGLSLESLEFNFPSFSRRALGDYRPSSPTVLDSGEGKRPTVDGSGFHVFNCTWYGGDGPTLRYRGTAPVFRNNLVAWNDWSAADDLGHTGLGGWVFDFSGG